MSALGGIRRKKAHFTLADHPLNERQRKVWPVASQCHALILVGVEEDCNQRISFVGYL
jgi:hypothetical protein